MKFYFQEINLIEVARLQNAILHSVPLMEFNRLLKDYKYLLHNQTIGGGAAAGGGGAGGSGSQSDAGYQSAEDEVPNFDI